MNLSDVKQVITVTPQAIAQAKRLALSESISVVEALGRVTSMPPSPLMAELGEMFRYPVLEATALQAVRPDFDRIAFTECQQRGILAAVSSAGMPLLVLSDPFDGMAEEWAFRRFGALRSTAHVAIAHPRDLAGFLTTHQSGLRAMDSLSPSAGAGNESKAQEEISLASIGEDTSPVVKLVNSTVYDALQAQASDIHFECDASGLRVLYRVDGVLVEVAQVAGPDVAEQVISRVKVLAELDIAERRVPQDGRFRVRVSGRDVDFRVSVMPSIFGEDAVLRLLDRQSLTQQTQAFTLEKLGLDAHVIAPIRRLASRPHGMLLVTGPTGSGKTTTLYAAITEIHTGQDKVVTIEDPVEYRLPRVLQIPVNEKKGLTFARGLRSILRHDPDKIMVGEIRDDETAQIAVQAALTGHLVLTTVHANNVFDVLGRFLHMGVDPYSFAAALNGIVSQRLLRLVCPHCAHRRVPSDAVLAEASLTREAIEGWTPMAGAGCTQCRGAGYKGRKAVAEVLVLNDALRELLATKAPISALKEQAQAAGLCSLRDAALKWVADGRTTLEEVLRVAG